MIGRSVHRGTLVALLFGLLPAFALQNETGTICVAPLPKVERGPDGSFRAGDPALVCKSMKYSFKMDRQPAVPWPATKSLSLKDVPLAGRHRIVVLCENKPLQTFTFQFSEFKDKKLCLFLNDLYWTVQLWPDKRCPWCKCE